MEIQMQERRLDTVADERFDARAGGAVMAGSTAAVDRHRAFGRAILRIEQNVKAYAGDRQLRDERAAIAIAIRAAATIAIREVTRLAVACTAATRAQVE